MGGQQAGGISVDADLMKDIIRAAVADQPDDAQIDLIVQAISGCCSGGTLGVADADAIMSKLQELAGGQQAAQGGQQMGGQQMAPMGGQQAAPAMGGQQAAPAPAPMGQQDPATADIAPGDGEVAGPEGGQQHQGKTKLMSGLGESTKTKGKKMTLAEAWIMGVPGVGVNACIGESGFDDEVDEDTIELRKMARKAGNPEWFNVGRSK
jgi:hypothetical protein